MIGVSYVSRSNTLVPLRVDVVSVVSDDEADEVSASFCEVYIKVRPISSRSCVGISVGGGVYGKRARRAPALALEDELESPWTTPLLVKGVSLIGLPFSARGWLCGVEKKI